MIDICGITVLRLSFEKFRINSQEFFPTKFLRIFWNPEIPEKFLGLGHHVYGFLGEFIKRISFEKFLGISLELHPKKSWEFLLINSPEIPEKFLGHHVYGFLGELIKRISFKKFLVISPEFYPKKIFRISPDYFSENSWEILSTWSPSLRIFRGIK